MVYVEYWVELEMEINVVFLLTKCGVFVDRLVCVEDQVHPLILHTW